MSGNRHGLINERIDGATLATARDTDSSKTGTRPKRASLLFLARLIQINRSLAETAR
jgi:hypothetical protein